MVFLKLFALLHSMFCYQWILLATRVSLVFPRSSQYEYQHWNILKRKIENIFIFYISYGEELTAICLLCIVFCYRSHFQRSIIHVHTEKTDILFPHPCCLKKTGIISSAGQDWVASSFLPKSSLIQLTNPWTINKSITKSIVSK